MNGIFQPNPPFDVDDIGRLADLCGFDSQASGESWKGWSHWCRLLRRDEWEVAGYVADVARWYRVGEGSVSPLREVRRVRKADNHSDLAKSWVYVHAAQPAPTDS